MNRVINVQRYGKGWRVEAVTPSGRPIVVVSFGSLVSVIEEALQDSVVHWQGAADHNTHLAGLLASLCDPTYDRKVSSLTRERARLERLVKQRRDTLARLRKAKEAGKIC